MIITPTGTLDQATIIIQPAFKKYINFGGNKQDEVNEFIDMKEIQNWTHQENKQFLKEKFNKSIVSSTIFL